jgi:hypothetical protein
MRPAMWALATLEILFLKNLYPYNVYLYTC